MLPVWAEAFSNVYDEDALLCSIQEDTGTVLGTIEQVSKKVECSINETLDQLLETDREACNDELFPPFYFERENLSRRTFALHLTGYFALKLIIDRRGHPYTMTILCHCC
ncbi:hypothetical protein DINM_002213 [Dirofilaria immitis]|nr:hypothetical protein [Dirofilaria immitis]